jgi:uncharacterized short protein YbdD (DUF466 family)
MRNGWNAAKNAMVRFWQGLREWCGDAAYEKYVQRSLRMHQENILTPAEFYVEQLNEKYSRPNRCC